jgi:beta-xylosidase
MRPLSTTRAALLSLCLFLCPAVGTVAQQSPAAQQGPAAQQSAGAYSNPVMAGDYPDPTVIRVGADYWAMSTTGGWAPHFSILRSGDLVNWQVVGSVFRTPPRWVRGDFWAPEVAEDGGRFLVFYTGRRDDGPGKRGTLCVALATAHAPAGPYTDHGPLVCQISERGGVGSIDAFFVRDENNDPYLVWKADGNDAEPDQPTSIYAQRLSDDFRKLTGKRKEILRNTEPWEKHVTEGSYILRRGGWFYHFYSGNACCGRSCNYALGVARSRKLLGPWEKSPSNPILAANDAWQCPGHGSIVATADGRDFLLYHAYRKSADAFHIGREALLDEVRWNDDGWPVVNEGRGPSGTAPAPAKAAPRPARTEFFDGFTAPELDASWQWPMSSEQSARVDTATGFLTLAPGAKSKDNLTGAVLAQRVSSGDYVATTLVDTRGMSAGATAGIAAYGWRNNAVGVAVKDGGVIVWQRDGGPERLMRPTFPVPGVPAIYLRMTATGGEQFRFAFSANGRDWKNVGPMVNAASVEGARVALVAGSAGTTAAAPAPGVGGGGARFDWVKITPARRPVGN